MEGKDPRILVLDIETSPITASVWGIWDQNIGLNQIKDDWSILAYGAKWYDPNNPKVIYNDTREGKTEKTRRDDKQLVRELRDLLDEATHVITQNGAGFDIPRINARILKHKIVRPTDFISVDTLKIAKKHFGFTSNKLEYMADHFNVKYKKLKHEKFPGFDLWKACLAGNMKAWKEMEKYNKYDVLSLEELVGKLLPWEPLINKNHFTTEASGQVCFCGSTNLIKTGFKFTSRGKFQRYQCRDCGSVTRSSKNLFTKVKKEKLVA